MEEEFASLAEAAFSKLKWVETEGPDPDQTEFAKLAAFLKDSNAADQFLQKLVCLDWRGYQGNGCNCVCSVNLFMHSLHVL